MNDLYELLVVCVVIGLPVALMWALKMQREVTRIRELDLERRKFETEAALRQDELNAKILRMDDQSISPLDLASLTEEIRQLRQEVTELKRTREIGTPP